MKRCVIFPTKSGEFLQFLALLAVQVARHFNEQPRVEIAAFATVNVHNALPVQTKALPALRTGRDFQARFSFQSRHRNFAAEGRGREGDRDFAKEIVVFALEDRVFLNVDDNVKVALAASAETRFAVTDGAQTGAMVDAGRNFQFDPAGFVDPAFAAAGLQGRSMASPGPRQRGQVCETWKKPRELTTWPRRRIGQETAREPD